MKRLLRAAALLLAALLCILPMAAAGHATLYVGDSAYHGDSLSPFIESNGRQLVPLAAFGEFDALTLTVSESLGSFLLEGADSVWLSVSLGRGESLDETGEVHGIALYRYNGELYVEPTTICEKFGLSFETIYAADGYLRARLTDGSETLTFPELLAAYETTGSTGAPVSLAAITDRTVDGTFLQPIFLDPRTDAVAGLVRLSGRHGATFAIAPASLAAYADVLPLIYASGHTVAYYADADALASPITFAAEMQAANDLLFTLLGKTTRIYVSTAPASDMPAIDGYFGKSCRMNLVAEDLSSERMTNMVLAESPSYGVFNFSLSTDADSRALYRGFFRKFDTYPALRAMPLTEASAAQ